MAASLMLRAGPMVCLPEDHSSTEYRTFYDTKATSPGHSVPRNSSLLSDVGGAGPVTEPKDQAVDQHTVAVQALNDKFNRPDGDIKVENHPSTHLVDEDERSNEEHTTSSDEDTFDPRRINAFLKDAEFFDGDSDESDSESDSDTDSDIDSMKGVEAGMEGEADEDDGSSDEEEDDDDDDEEDDEEDDDDEEEDEEDEEEDEDDEEEDDDDEEEDEEDEEEDDDDEEEDDDDEEEDEEDEEEDEEDEEDEEEDEEDEDDVDEDDDGGADEDDDKDEVENGGINSTEEIPGWTPPGSSPLRQEVSLSDLETETKTTTKKLDDDVAEVLAHMGLIVHTDKRGSVVRKITWGWRENLLASRHEESIDPSPPVTTRSPEPVTMGRGTPAKRAEAKLDPPPSKYTYRLQDGTQGERTLDREAFVGSAAWAKLVRVEAVRSSENRKTSFKCILRVGENEDELAAVTDLAAYALWCTRRAELEPKLRKRCRELEEEEEEKRARRRT
ncbi:hypothetical protein PYCCODRAFT_1471526 [Trametes coccinea BRFM310]|uniref:Uncharacterized protein n=1 Tax=Trametes coccinea (strain BRFM310) TaxID=1353009 RepID=A0A1Y2IB26_TRAC3|nr:hypothetical protein PYCCODRAFT_1471526 [Trametes coccinea BRFM310]